MVHALEQAHRVLRARGHVIDLHPERGSRTRYGRRLPVFVRADADVPAGYLRGRPGGYDDYLAADRAVARVLRRGLFTLESTEVLALRDHLRSLEALEHVLATEWIETTLGPSTRRRLQALLYRHPAGKIVVVEAVRFNLLRKP